MRLAMILPKYLFVLCGAAIAFGSNAPSTAWPGQNPPKLRVRVEMVQLNVAVTDKKGGYITGLPPDDFVVTEDGIQQKIAMFAEGDNAPKKITEMLASEAKALPVETSPPAGSAEAKPMSGNSAQRDSTGVADADGIDNDPLAHANVFILFDTSNYMYRGFVFAQDAIAGFIRSLQGPDRVALYSYSRDLFRASPLTSDRIQLLRGVRTMVAGDDAALYDALLLTLRDATNLTGRRVIVVFSNGPDNASLAPPEDVEELAQSEGVAIYMISTRQAEQDPLSTKVFKHISLSTGGEAYFARNWMQEKSYFAAIGNDLAHLYSLYYYPQPNPNRGWRKIGVTLKRAASRKYKIRARSGYRPLPSQPIADGSAS